MRRVVAMARLVLALIISSAAAAHAQVSVWFDPGGGPYTTSAVTVDVYFCSETAPLTSERFIVLNNVDVTYVYFSYIGTGGACNGWGEHWRGTVELQMGSNELYAYAYSQDDQWGSATGTFVYSLPVATVTVTNNGAGTLGVGQTTTMVARAFAPNGTELFGHTFYWSGTRMHVSAQGNPERTSVTVTADVAGQGSMTAMTSNVSGSANVTVVNPSYAVAVSSNRPSNITLSAGATSTGTTTYTVTNNTSYTSASSTFTMTATPTGVIGTCNVSPTSYTLAPNGGSTNVTVSCPVGLTTATSSPTVTFRARATSPVTFEQTHVTTFSVSPSFAFSVSRPNGATVTVGQQATSGSAVFRIHNSSTNTGSLNVSYNATCSPVASCSVANSVSVAEGSYSDVTIPFGVGAVGINGSVSFSTTTPGGSNPGSSMSVVTTPYYGGVDVTGPANQTIPQGNASGSTSFTVQNKNKNVGLVTYTLAKTCSTPLFSNCGSQPSVSLNDQASSSIPVTYNVNLSESSGSVSLQASSISPSASDMHTTSLTATPIISVAYSEKYRDVDRCIASCFAATASYSTPSYTSLDAPKAVTLIYRSDRAKPFGLVEIDASDNQLWNVAAFSLKLKRPDNSPVTFLGGLTQVYFADAPGTTRLAVQFDATSLATGAYAYTAVVTTHYATGSPVETTIPVRVLIDNAAASPFGAGWEVEGIQRAYVQSDGVLITSGDGSMSFFAGCSGTCQLTSPAGDFSTLYRLSSGTYERRYPDGTKLTFTSAGYLTAIRDRFNQGPNVTWVSGRLSTIVDAAGKTTSFLYDGANKLSQIQTPAVTGSRTSTFTVWSGNLTQATDPDAIVNFTASYTGNQLTQLTDRRGGQWNYQYGADWRLDAVLAPQILAGGSNQRPTTLIATPSLETLKRIALGWDGANQSDPVPHDLDRRASIRSPRGHTTYFSVNRWGSPLKVDYPTGPSSTAQYNSMGQATQAVSSSGHTMNFTWSGVQLTQVQDVSTGQTINALYESIYNRPIRITGHAPARDTLTYPDLKTITVASGTHPATTIKLDAFGRDSVITDPGGHQTKFYRSTSGMRNLDSVKAISNSARTWYRYDNYGRVRAVVGPDGVRDSTTYDALNRVIASTNGLNHTTSFAYGNNVDLTGVTDANGQTTTFARNALGWITSEQRAGSANPLLTKYDLNGNVDTLINRRGQVVVFAYDQLDRMTSRAATGMWATTFGYLSPTPSSEGYVAATNSESSDTLYFNSADRLVRAATAAHGDWYRLAYDYDTYGRRTGINATSNTWTGTKSQTFGYNPTGALSSLTAWGATTGLNPGAANEDLATAVTYPNSLVLGRDFGELHLSYTANYSVGTVQSVVGHHVGLDVTGRITRYSGADGKGNKAYYDNGRRLQTFEKWNMTPQSCPTTEFTGCTWADSSFISATSFSYDPAGNLLNGVTSLSVPGNRVTAANGKSYFYDADGNVSYKAGTGFADQTFSWDALGQLTSVTSVEATATFGYDAFGRRVRQTVDSVTTYSLHDGDNLFIELDSLGNSTAEYAYWGLDRPHAMRKGGTTFYFALDPISGNVRGLIAESTNSVPSQFRYTPFGELEFATDPAGMPFRFGGREYDAATGLYHMRARYYDPSIGRFISEDPIGLAGGTNLYAYAANDPINNHDPYGQECKRIMTKPGTRIEAGSTVITEPPEYVTICTTETTTAGGSGGGGGGGGGGRGAPTKLPKPKPVPYGPLPMCSRAQFTGNSGTIEVQYSSSSGFLQWGVTMHNPATRGGPGVWAYQEFVGGRPVSGAIKPNEGMLHGSVNPTKLASGEFFQLAVVYRDAFGFIHHSVPNACIIP